MTHPHYVNIFFYNINNIVINLVSLNLLSILYYEPTNY